MKISPKNLFAKKWLKVEPTVIRTKIFGPNGPRPPYPVAQQKHFFHE
jgi:hypothetical protein